MMSVLNRFPARSLLLIVLMAALPLTAFVTPDQIGHRQQAERSALTTVTIDLSTPQGMSQFSTGVTHTQDDLAFSDGDQTAIASAKKLLQSSLTFQNAFLMGWGTDNPEPSPGSYDWSTLDARVQLMRDTGAIKMISLCCSPTWMFDGNWVGRTDWNRLETAPLPGHFADYANLARQAALRYPDVQYFQVWNELKGFWNDSLNRWDYEGYTALYNMVYDAIKSVRPTAKIGGPYIGVDMGDKRTLDVISYWLAHKHGADFIVLDGGYDTQNATEDFTTADYFLQVARWLRQQPYGGSTLPFGWAEWYPGSSHDWQNTQHFNAILANALISTLQSGASYALPWGIQGDSQGLTGAYRAGDGNPEGMMTNQGQPTPFYFTLKAFHDDFGPGTSFYKATSSSSEVTVLASQSKIMLVNHLAISQRVSVNGSIVILSPFQVALINTSPSASIPSTTTQGVRRENHYQVEAAKVCDVEKKSHFRSKHH